MSTQEQTEQGNSDFKKQLALKSLGLLDPENQAKQDEKDMLTQIQEELHRQDPGLMYNDEFNAECEKMQVWLTTGQQQIDRRVVLQQFKRIQQLLLENNGLRNQRVQLIAQVMKLNNPRLNLARAQPY